MSIPVGFIPAGTVVACAADDDIAVEIPGWAPCDGSIYEAIKYPELFKAIGYANGGLENSGLFHVPDLRGHFLRG